MSAVYNVDYFRRKNWGGLFSIGNTSAKLTGVTMPPPSFETYNEEIWVRFERLTTFTAGSFSYLITNNLIELIVTNTGEKYDILRLSTLSPTGCSISSDVPIYPNVIYIARVYYDMVDGSNRKYNLDVFTEYGGLLQSNSEKHTWTTPTTTLEFVVGGKDGSTSGRFKGFIYDVMVRNAITGTADGYRKLWNFRQTGSNLNKIENQLDIGTDDLDIVNRDPYFWSPGAVALTNVKGAKIVSNYDRWGLKKESTLNLDVYAPELSSLKLVRGDWIRISVEDGAVKTIEFYKIVESTMDRQGVRRLKCQSIDTVFKEYKLAYYDNRSSYAKMQNRYFWWMEDYTFEADSFVTPANIAYRAFNIMQLGAMLDIVTDWYLGSRFWEEGAGYIPSDDLGFYGREINMWNITEAQPSGVKTENGIANVSNIKEALNSLFVSLNVKYEIVNISSSDYMRFTNRNFNHSPLNIDDGFNYKNDNSIKNKAIGLKVTVKWYHTQKYKPQSYSTEDETAENDVYNSSYSDSMPLDIYEFPARFWLCYNGTYGITLMSSHVWYSFINQLYRLKSDEIIFNQPTEKATMPGNLAFQGNFIEYTSNISMQNPTTTIKQIKE